MRCGLVLVARENRRQVRPGAEGIRSNPSGGDLVQHVGPAAFRQKQGGINLGGETDAPEG